MVITSYHAFAQKETAAKDTVTSVRIKDTLASGAIQTEENQNLLPCQGQREKRASTGYQSTRTEATCTHPRIYTLGHR